MALADLGDQDVVEEAAHLEHVDGGDRRSVGVARSDNDRVAGRVGVVLGADAATEHREPGRRGEQCDR